MLSDIDGLGAKNLIKLSKLAINTEEELVNFLPFSYMDLSKITNLETAADGDYVLLDVEITSASRPFKQKNLSIFRALAITENNSKIQLMYFNHTFASKEIVVGRKIRVYGKINIKKTVYSLNNALFSDTLDNKLTGIKSIYPTRGVLPSTTLKKYIYDSLKTYLPISVISKQQEIASGLISLKDAYYYTHFPNSLSQTKDGKRRLNIEEMVRLILAHNLTSQEHTERDFLYSTSKDIIRQVKMPYQLTPTQDKAVNDIISVLLSEKRLNGMLIGDVGSGKTAVCCLVSFFVAKSNGQVAVMAPTEILARQHYNTFQSILRDYGIKIGLLVGSLKASEKKEVCADIASGSCDIIIGTHAVISAGVEFYNLTMMIVDEQHRFGVGQRTALLKKGMEIDTLTISATPIPRSLLLTVYGDVLVYNIDVRHASTNIKTALVKPEKIEGMFRYIVDEAKKGKKAFIIAPKVVDDERSESFACLTIYQELCDKFGEEVKIGLAYGGLKNKDKVIQDFANGDTSILVATTVVEVGIDVPGASIMAIMDAEKFGLATLHQLRGRIGRQGEAAYCFLYTTKTEEEEIQRLITLVKERDGIKIAEADYAMRGAGEYLSQSQSGKSGIQLSLTDVHLCKALAESIDASSHIELLNNYIKKLDLERVSLN